jgi:V-type H+-transporting ATPase subunit a
MFGDIGHGTLIFILASYMCLNKNNIMQGESLLKQGLKYRYFLLLMGFFSLFCGLMYNDMMALPLSFFSSCYNTDYKTLETTRKPNCVYPVGIDPKWYAATNDLSFLNSFKMKWSVIIGVLQMTLGIVLRGLNNLYFKDYVGFIFEAIPQIIFMSLLFGYMIVMIFIKWSKDWSADYSKAPSIISILMGIGLSGGSVNGKPLWGSIPVEEKTNRIFLYISICCVPLILLPKPIIKILSSGEDENKKINEKISDASEPLLEDDEIIVRMPVKEEKHESPTDIFVHQIIETIEFVLGCVSNTASYLRLWALSLAHAQLSKVFFEKALLGFAQQCNLILVIIGYFVFANVTVSVLMGMDLLESFLHTLRLHWVEFQNKFYAADGVKYVPFSFRDIIEAD